MKELRVSIFIRLSECWLNQLSFVDFNFSSLLSNCSYQQSVGRNRKLLHYSVSRHFYPNVLLAIRPDDSSPSSSSIASLKSLILLTWVLFVVGMAFLYTLSCQMQDLSRSLEDHALAIGPGWNDRPEPYTITTTVHSALNSSRWWFNGEASTTEADSVPTHWASSSVTTITPPPSLTPVAFDTQEISTSAAASSASFIELALFRSFSWPVFDQEKILDAIKEKADAVWQVLRKIYHYPLDPP